MISARHLISGALCLFVLGCASLREGPSSVDTSATPDVVGARKIIALLPDERAANDMRIAATTRGYRELEENRLDGLGLMMLTFRMPGDVTGGEAIAVLEKAVPNSTVGINHAYRLQQNPKALEGLDYANNMMRWDKNGCFAQEPIGIIDTGVNTKLPNLKDMQIVTRAFFAGPAAIDTHGTDIVSLLADPSRLQSSKIYAANVFGQQDASDLKAGADALVRALDWLALQDVHFVNLALAGPYNKLLDLAVERAVSQGLILVAAVGNDGPTVGPRYPAGFDDVIAVTAVDVNGHIYRHAVRGTHVDVAAPGVDVLVSSGQTARFVTGTSIATPLVTARLAVDPSLVGARSVSDVRRRLAATSAELGSAGRDRVFGYGLAMAENICGG